MSENSYNKIIENLYIGSAAALRYLEHFSFIVNCTKDIPLPKNHKNVIRIPVDDDVVESDVFITLINDTNVLERIHYGLFHKKPVLVHCYAGSQRSCALVACYLIKYCHMNVDEAVVFIKSKRSCAFYDEVRFISILENIYNKKIS